MKFTHLCRNPLGLKASGTGSGVIQAANFTSLHPVCKLASPQKSRSFSAQCKHTINLEIISRSVFCKGTITSRFKEEGAIKPKAATLKMKKSYHWLHWIHVHRKGNIHSFHWKWKKENNWARPTWSGCNDYWLNWSI